MAVIEAEQPKAVNALVLDLSLIIALEAVDKLWHFGGNYGAVFVSSQKQCQILEGKVGEIRVLLAKLQEYPIKKLGNVNNFCTGNQRCEVACFELDKLVGTR